MTQEEDQKDAANAFAGLFGFVAWFKKQGMAVIVGGSLVGGGYTLMEKVSIHPAPVEKTDAVLTNQVKGFELLNDLAADMEDVKADVHDMKSDIRDLKHANRHHHDGDVMNGKKLPNPAGAMAYQPKSSLAYNESHKAEDFAYRDSIRQSLKQKEVQ